MHRPHTRRCLTPQRPGGFVAVLTALALFCLAGPAVKGESADLDALEQRLVATETATPAQVEVGGPFVGVATHNSSPLACRISFYYPVANSIDASTDYWTRDRSRVMRIGLRIADGPPEWIGLSPLPYRLTPYSVVYRSADDRREVTVSYEFCKTSPAMVLRIGVTHRAAEARTVQLFTEMNGAVKTSHASQLRSQAWTQYATSGSTIYVNHDAADTGPAQLFFANAGLLPRSFSSRRATPLASAEDQPWPTGETGSLGNEVIPRESPAHPAAAFLYEELLDPGERMAVVQLVGACKPGEGPGLVKSLLTGHQAETEAYRRTVLDVAFRRGQLTSGDDVIDNSVHWARAILEANAHYLDGEIRPMPCPAEYNFFFTHDALLTDLAAVSFDPARVRRDLSSIVRLADADRRLPHAYYWKEDRYVVEPAGPDSWNHFWFVIVAASYYRHTRDAATLEALLPFMERSVELATTNVRDDLVWGYRPDWWDIGSSFGPRAYLTILAIRALRDLAFVSTALGKPPEACASLAERAGAMQVKLRSRLWDDQRGFLCSFLADGTRDSHFYIGSLLAAHFGSLDGTRRKQLVKTATLHLLEPGLGVRNAFPMDFHLLEDYLKFSGGEAGKPTFYMNGGIWPHGNAWYALALLSMGDTAGAYDFVRETMTVQGIARSPHGFPAMYEYRNCRGAEPSLDGRIDKPQFLWAGSWYLYCLYQLFGLRENVWNLSFAPSLPKRVPEASFCVTAGGRELNVTVMGEGSYFARIEAGDRLLPTAVIPVAQDLPGNVVFRLGRPEVPYIAETESELLEAHLDPVGKSLLFRLAAHEGHPGRTRIVSAQRPVAATVGSEPLRHGWKLSETEGLYILDLEVPHTSTVLDVAVHFE